jgi:hypothetical protein
LNRGELENEIQSPVHSYSHWFCTFDIGQSSEEARADFSISGIFRPAEYVM